MVLRGRDRSGGQELLPPVGRRVSPKAHARGARDNSNSLISTGEILGRAAADRSQPRGPLPKRGLSAGTPPTMT